MDINSLLYSLGLSGFFASRAFLPAFASALVAKYGSSLPFLGDIEFLQKMSDAPHWFTNPMVVWGLGILAAVELIGEKSPDVRQIMDEGMTYVKPALSAATSFGLLSATDVEAVNEVISHAGILDTIPALISAGATYFLASTRQGVVEILNDADEDDTLGIRGFISWCEEFWALFGVWILIALPVVVVALLGFVYGVLWMIRKRHESKMEAAKIECPSCQTRIHPFATACYSCGHVQERPKKLSFLGGIQEETESDPVAQKVRLLELRRSPLSGDRAEEKGVDAKCETDGVTLLGDKELTGKYLERVDARLFPVMLFGALFSLIPGLGLIIGVIYYRFQLVAPYRRYLPWKRGFVVRWLIRLVFILLVILQFVPVVGAAAVPLMAFINHRFYRSAFRSELLKKGMLPA
ncbi:DUF4126 family protein [Pelagicoccus sp. SDUM812003]|uniref:DUF4126 family protein n=1 Tax=Pelagicoccus sp. SDUM812003 TaxID=3041267 RepID=UPI00280E86B4|nr:DUF4126 family protein [Pelagicoccus sp. SDUM812003]MDQ8201691.1 DUF4126 family protein [Pelagicoccus sp. SDUM812003]